VTPETAAHPHLPFTPQLGRLLADWLAEDLGRGDLTAGALADRRGSAQWLAKADGLFCGGVLVEPLFRLLDPQVAVQLLVADGEPVHPGQPLLELEGGAAALVAGERTALNLAMRLSGIATATAALVAELAGTGVRLADTRKTTPVYGCWRSTRCAAAGAPTTASASTMRPCSRRTTWPGPAGWAGPSRRCGRRPPGRPG
jgi:nicotinate-nucleotide pyrophosphorylase